MSTLTTQDMRPLISENSTFKPVKQIFSGYEIEKRQVLLTMEEDHTKAKNALVTYNEVLEKGCLIDQGYIKDTQVAIDVLTKLGIELQDFKPNTIRFRRFGPNHKESRVSKYPYVLTLKDRKEVKKREVEFKLSPAQFKEFWPLTEGARVQKKRMRKKVKEHLLELDAFTDRLLLIVECEVDTEELLKKVPKLGMDVTGNSAWTNKSLAK